MTPTVAPPSAILSTIAQSPSQSSLSFRDDARIGNEFVHPSFLLTSPMRPVRTMLRFLNLSSYRPSMIWHSNFEAAFFHESTIPNQNSPQELVIRSILHYIVSCMH